MVCVHLGSVGDAFELAVPIVLALDHATTVELSALKLNRHNVTQSLVEKLHWNSQAPAHLVSSSSSLSLSLSLPVQKP